MSTLKTGTGTGALIATLVAIHTDEELPAVLSGDSINLGPFVDHEHKRHVAVLCKAVEIAQLKGCFNLRDAKLVAEAFEAFVPENISTITPATTAEGANDP